MAASKARGFLPSVKAVVSLDDRLAKWRAESQAIGVDWREVSATALRAAISVCLSNGYHITFAPAAGSYGLCIKLWNGGPNRSEYSFDAATTEDLLLGLVALLGSESEDVLQAMSGGKD